MNNHPGTYILLLHAPRQARVQVGRWGELAVRRGWYLYVGSAFGPGGVRARVGRHCRRQKSCHWHIDYLREQVRLPAAWYHQGEERLEHHWASVIAGLPGMAPIPGFGCSDCACLTHLYRAPGRPCLDDFLAATGVCLSESRCCQS